MEKIIFDEIKNGNKEAFKVLYNEYVKQISATAYSIVKNKSDVADIVQEVFIKVYKNIEKYDDSKPFKPWIYKILINECNTFFAKRNRFNNLFTRIRDSINYTNVYQDTDVFEYKELYDVIDSLKKIHKIPIVLKYLQGMKEREIADILDININTIKSRLFKARMKIKKELEKRGGDCYEGQRIR